MHYFVNLRNRVNYNNVIAQISHTYQLEDMVKSMIKCNFLTLHFRIVRSSIDYAFATRPTSREVKSLR